MKKIGFAFALVVISLVWVPPLRGQDIKENVLHALRQLGLENDVIVVGAGTASVYVRPVEEFGIDIFAEDLRNRKIWGRSSGSLTRLEHHSSLGWRERGNCSLHVVAYLDSEDSRYYEIHIDRWAPSWKKPEWSIMHIFGEWFPHKVAHRSTNQRPITEKLNKRDQSS